MAKVYPLGSEITVVFGNDDTVDSMWQTLQDLLRDKGMEDAYAEQSRSEDWIKIHLTDHYNVQGPMPEPCKEICHSLLKKGYKKQASGNDGLHFDS